MIAEFQERRKRLRGLLDDVLFTPMEDLAYRRIPNFLPNSIAWLSWHMARWPLVNYKFLNSLMNLMMSMERWVGGFGGFLGSLRFG